MNFLSKTEKEKSLKILANPLSYSNLLPFLPLELHCNSSMIGNLPTKVTYRDINSYDM